MEFPVFVQALPGRGTRYAPVVRHFPSMKAGREANYGLRCGKRRAAVSVTHRGIRLERR